MEIIFRTGEKAKLFKNANGYWHCPVCGSPELESAAYLEGGSGSFQMCSCGFEFGFDDEPSASVTEIKTVLGNWEHWREKKLQYMQKDSLEFKTIKENLHEIGVEVNT